jgi:hypothetical protein
MAFDINAFKTTGLPQGGARPSLFDVTMTPGAGITALNEFNFQCRAANLPMMNLDPIEGPYFGRKIKVKGDRTFQDWTVTIVNDEDFGVRNMMETWSNVMNTLESNIMETAALDEAYKGTAQVNQYAKSGALLRQYTFYGIWPSAVEAIDLNWESTNQIETFTTSFAYDYWLPGGTSGAGGGAGTTASYSGTETGAA